MKSRVFWALSLSVAMLCGNIYGGEATTLPQKRSIVGKVTDATGAPLAGATVVKKGTDIGTLVESDGSFNINLGVGDTLAVSFFGYKEAFIPVSKSGDINVVLVEDALMTEEVVVVGKKKQVIYKLDKRVVDAGSNLNAAGGSAVDILENTPSIRIDSDGEVTFRGSSGFTVYVDGKPSVFSGTQALEQVPSSQIENIEIITTPSARYDTDGDVGIINIVTKSSYTQDFSGVVTATGSTVASKGVNFMLNWDKSKSRWYLSGNASNLYRNSEFSQDKMTIVDDVTTISQSEGPRESMRYNYIMQTGWQQKGNNTNFYAELEGGHAGNKRDGDLAYLEYTYVDNVEQSSGEYVSGDKYNLYETYGVANVGMDHKFDSEGHNLTASGYVKYGGGSREYFQSDLYNMDGEREQGHRAWEDEFRWTARANVDYVYPYSETGKIEAGYQYFMYSEDGDYRMDYWDNEIGEFYDRDDIYNTFLFLRGIHSIYGIWNESLGSFEFQLGLRGEHTHRILESSKEWANRVENRFDLFPSTHLGYSFTKTSTLMASYSRRTLRPGLYYMEPYITYKDYYTAQIGNPDIRPEYINSVELTYSKNYDNGNSLSVSAFHRNRKDKIETLRVTYEAGVTLDSMANVGNDFSTGLELSGSWQTTRWWGMTLNGSLYHYSIKNYLEESGEDQSSTNYDVNWSNAFEIGDYTRIQFDTNFVGPSVTTQGQVDAFYFANLSVRQQFLKRRLSATMAMRDVFRTAKYTNNIVTSSLESYTAIRPSYPTITLTLSYTLNNYKAKKSKEAVDYDLFEGTNH